MSGLIGILESFPPAYVINQNRFVIGFTAGNLLALRPTVKPVAMIADAILDCSALGDIVLDNFSGVGSTILAAEWVRRICYAIEIDPLYVDTAVRRWEQQTGRQAVLAERQ